MPTYVKLFLHKLQYAPQKYPQYSPHHFDPIIFRRKGHQQMATQTPTEPLPKEKIIILSVDYIVKWCVTIISNGTGVNAMIGIQL